MPHMVYVFGDNLYGRKLIKIPEPRFVVFYNGTDKMPEQSVLRLSDAYESNSARIPFLIHSSIAFSTASGNGISF